MPALIRLVVPFAPGATSDVMARAIALQLAARLKTNVIVENRVGGTGIIASTAVINGPKDGSMLLFTSSSLVTSAATMRAVPFDVNKDLVPVAIVAEGPMLVTVSAKSGVKTPAELVAYARAKDGGMISGSAGIGSIGHLGAELLADAGKVPMRHIPYKGAALALVDLASGLVDVIVSSNSSVAPQIKAGRAIPIAVTSAQPSPHFPGLPPMAQAAPGYDTSIWYAVMAPAGVSPAVLQRLNHEFNEAAKAPEFQEVLKFDGAAPMAATLEELSRRVRTEHAMWKKIAASKNIVVD